MLVTLTEETILTAKLLKQGYRYYNLHKAFSKFYHRRAESVTEYSFGLKIHIKKGIYMPVFYAYIVIKVSKGAKIRN